MTRRDEQFYQWADNSPDAVFVGVHGYFRYLNRTAVQMFGATCAAQLLGKRIIDCVHPEAEDRAADRELEQRVVARTQELQEKERFLQEILNAIPIPLFFKELNGRYLGCNNAFAAVTGKTAAEIRGKTVFDLWPHDLATIYHQKDLELLDAPSPQHYESEMVDKFSQVRQVLYAKNVFSNDRGERAGIIGAFIDITERKRAEAELAERSAALTRANAELSLAASVFHESVEGVLVTDAESTILSVNPAFTEITGYTAAEAIGRKPRLLRSDRHDREFYRSMWDTLIKDGRWQGEIWNRRKSGEAYLEWLTINRIID
ncbi:MAG: PAS domain S-box protein, partial [Betaproteobacteria bacterium]|nr:PAS domain S-box protein [Betaproteobacteria bacterium]